MRLKVNYVVHVHKDIRRMVNWHLMQQANADASTSGMAELGNVSEFYRKFGADQMEQLLYEWIQRGRPE